MFFGCCRAAAANPRDRSVHSDTPDVNQLEHRPSNVYDRMTGRRYEGKKRCLAFEALRYSLQLILKT